MTVTIRSECSMLSDPSTVAIAIANPTTPAVTTTQSTVTAPVSSFENRASLAIYDLILAMGEGMAVDSG